MAWALGAGGLLAAHRTSAATLAWTNTAGGNWNVAANWSPNQVPGANDDAVITSAGSYTVTINSTLSVSNLTVGGCGQVIDNHGPLECVGGLLFHLRAVAGADEDAALHARVPPAFEVDELVSDHVTPRAVEPEFVPRIKEELRRGFSSATRLVRCLGRKVNPGESHAVVYPENEYNTRYTAYRYRVRSEAPFSSEVVAQRAGGFMGRIAAAKAHHLTR